MSPMEDVDAKAFEKAIICSVRKGPSSRIARLGLEPLADDADALFTIVGPQDWLGR
jgi:hypothetical protein